MITPGGMRVAVPAAAAIFTLPSWRQCLIEHSTSVESAAIRFAVALPVAWALLSLFQKAARVPASDSTAESDEGEHSGTPTLPN
jgi:hypothetical protein